MNKIILSFIVCAISLNMYSQRIGEWNTHFSYEESISSIAQANKKIYAVSDGKLFSYDTEDESVEIYSRFNAADITKIAYSKKQNCLIIIRNSGDIDFLYPDGSYTNIPDLKNVSGNLDKEINNIFISENTAYLSTNFGLVVLNIERSEIKETLIVRYPFYASCIYNGELYAATSNGSKKIKLTSNIQDINNWESISFNDKYSGGNFSDAAIRQFAEFDNYLIFVIPATGVYRYKDNVVNGTAMVNNVQDVSTNGSKLIVRGTSVFAEFSDLQSNATFKFYEIENSSIIQDNAKSNAYWIGVKNKNLSYIKTGDSNNVFETLKEEIKPSGPLSNYPYSLSFENNKLLYTGGRAGTNNYNYTGRWGELNDGVWYNCNISEVNTSTGKNILDVVSFKYDPYDPSHAFVCSWKEGLLEFKDRKLTKLYNETNSPFYRAWINLRISGGVFDKSGNFWLLNSVDDAPIKVIKKGTDTAIELEYDILAYNAQRTNMKNIVIDRYNNKWITTYGGTNFLAVFNENGTIENIKDDKVKFVKEFYSQDGDALTITNFNDIAEDKTGNMWIGTNIGVFVVYNSTNIFDRELIFNKIKIPRNDGTNTADILLEEVPVASIVVDGGNRKWLGTLTGVYVVSPNGQEIIHHFTMENSLLPSNSILSMAMDHEKGIIYIGSEKGIVSYKSEATEGAESYSNVYAYPNPVEPNYEGPITITGLKANSTVKITDVKGNLINEGKSIGGQYIWDGRNVKRDRVDTGIYLVFGASEDGSDGVVTKIMVVTN